MMLPMNPTVLEIAIPTFNRAEPLRRTVASLLPQLREGVRIRIIDNASDYDVSELLMPLLGESVEQSSVLIERNPCNIGLAGNILRCFERSDAEWLYLMGDDDLIKPDLVSTALDATKRFPEAFQVNFSGFFRRSVTIATTGLEQALGALDSYANLNFISTNMYRCRMVRHYMHIGHRLSYTLSPHIALTLSGLGHGGTLVLSSDQTVDRPEIDTAEHWNWTKFCLAQGLLAEHPSLTDFTRPLLMSKIEGSAKVLEKVTINLLLRARDKTRASEQLFFYRQFVLRWFYFSQSSSQRFKIWLYRWLFLNPTISIHIIFLGLRLIGRPDKVDEYLKASGETNRL
jgi:glycosyltransferase involved in cell wall biosynthesis